MTAHESASLLSQVSEALATTVESVAASVVRVEARRRGNASGLAWSSDGLVITTHHSTQRDQRIRIGLPSGERVDAELIGRDPTTDIAVLRADAGLQPPDWASIDDVRVGHLVLSVGRHDEKAQATFGIVAQKNGPWRTGAGGEVDAYLQTDLTVYPGFSGSALVEAGGRVVGMNTSWFRGRSALTLPHPTLKRVVEALVEHGHIRRGYLGISAQPANLPRTVVEELGQEVGLLVFGVEDESPAEQAGVIPGDLIVALSEEQVVDLDDLLHLLSSAQVGRALPLRIVRGGQVQTLTITPSER